jgi:hypothetical protein
MKELFSDFEAMKAHVKASKLRFRDALLDYFREVGERQGFTVLRDSSVIVNAFDFGKVDLAWVEPNVVFAMEFGVPDDIYRHLFRIMAMKPAIAVLLLSGNSQCNPRRVKELVARTVELRGIEFVLLDVTSNALV